MSKLINISKTAAVSAAFAMAGVLPAGVAHAATTTTTNTTTSSTVCQHPAKTVTKNGNTFSAIWSAPNTFTITAQTAFTSDVTVYASSYHLLDDLYTGGCFSHDPAQHTYPQAYDGNTQTIVLPEGFVGTKVVTVVLPDACYNEQMDLYSGDSEGQPLNGEVGQAGHDNYGWITGSTITKAQNPQCEGGRGGGTPPPVETPPVAPVAATLTNTGLNIRLTSLLAAGILFAAGTVFTRRARTSEE